MTPPNILFLMSDEHRPDVIGYEGDAVIRTPVLDELARTGVTFNNAYTPSPVCVPARQCLMSGQLPKTCGVEGWTDLPPFSMTWARRFSEYAYMTTCLGKLHHLGSDQMQGWLNRPMGDMSIGHMYFEAAEGVEPPPKNTLHKWSDAKEVRRAGVGRGPYQIFDERMVQGSIDFIEGYFIDSFYDRPTPEHPLLMKVSLLQPHYPYFTSADLFNYYINRVSIFSDDRPADHPALSGHRVIVGEDISVREMQRATATYYGMVETIDTLYGRVMSAVEQAGQDLDDWIIIYTSDHGEMLGQHGIWEKKSFYEASACVPLIIRWPKGFEGGRVVEENVNLCDLFATLCDLADIPVPDGLDSRSLAPLLRGEPVEWRNESVSQLHGKYLMIKQGALKYCYFGEHPEVLFDLESDPGEMINFVDDPAYTEAVAAFRQRRSELGFGPNADPGYVNAGYAPG